MKDPRREYEAALADFSQPHNRWINIPRLTYWGKAAGLTAEDIVADARVAGVKDRDADIRRGWDFVTPKACRRYHRGRRNPSWAKHRTPPSNVQLYVRDMVAAGAGEATSSDLIALSPFAIPSNSREQAAAFLMSLRPRASTMYLWSSAETSLMT